MYPRVRWPDDKTFAFTVFDDPDMQQVREGRLVYDFLRDLGFRTTKGVWPIRGDAPGAALGGTCDDPDYLAWVLELQASGFEIGYHNAAPLTATREQTARALDRFTELFGSSPRTMANHYGSAEAIYWGPDRLSGVRRLLYNVMTLGRRRKLGVQAPGHPLFWGDLCRERVTYVRNFVYREINTLKVCPFMPYHDPARAYVNRWYAGAEGSDVDKLMHTLTDANVDRLVDEGGVCVAYVHFAYGYVDAKGQLDARFRRTMTRLSRLKGWFAPVSTVLDHLAAGRPTHVITDAERSGLEWRWLRSKALHGTS